MSVKTLYGSFLLMFVMVSCGKPMEVMPHVQTVKNQATRPNQPIKQTQNTIFNLPKSSNILGLEKALMNVVVFVDYSSAVCARNNRVIRQVLQDEAYKNIINLSFRHYPLTTDTIKPAKIALAAGLQGNDKFWQMSQKLFEADGDLKEESYLLWAKEIRLDVNKFAKDILEKDQQLANIIAKDKNMGNQIRQKGSALGVFVDGHLFRHAMTVDNFKRFVMAVKNHKQNRP